jgi:hypothetical protein
LIIQTIQQDPSRSVWIDEALNVSRPDPSGADQIDAEHQATDLAVGAARRLAGLGYARAVPMWLSLRQVNGVMVSLAAGMADGDT